MKLSSDHLVNPPQTSETVAKALENMMSFARSKMDDPSRADDMRIFKDAESALRALKGDDTNGLDWKPLPLRRDIAGQYAPYSDLTAARSEIERLTQTVENCRHDFRITLERAVKAEAERDEARALEAAAFEAAANASMESGPSYFMTQTGGGFQETHTKLGAFAFRTDIRDAIRTLTPADAKAALEDYGREKMREGMQRAVDIAEKCWESVYSQQTKEMIRVEMEKLK